MLGPHDTPAGGSSAPSCPAPTRSRCCGAATAQSLGRLEHVQPDGLFAGVVSDRAPYLLRIAWPDAVQETEDPYSSARCSAISTCICSTRAATSSSPQALGANVRDRRRRARRALRGLGAERHARVGGRRLQQLGRAPPSDAAALQRRRLGAVRAARRHRARATSTTSSAPDGMRCRRRPIRWRTQTETAAGHRLRRRRSPSLFAGTTRPGWRPRARARRRTRRSRSTRCISARGCASHDDGDARCGTIATDRLDPLCRRHGLHPCRADADHRASVRRLVGLPAARPVRADRRASARPEDFARFVDALPRGRHRRHPRLGAGAFPDRRARPRALRRHRALRASRSARGLSSGLEHAASTISAAARCRAS